MSLGSAMLIAALTGFIALSCELLWYRVVSFLTGSAPWAFGILLGAYLAGVAAASAVTQRLCERPSRVRGGAALVAGFVIVADAAAYLTVPALAACAVAGAWLLSLGLAGAAAGLLGAVLPLVVHFAVPPDRLAGARVSYVYLADIVGSALGSAVTGYLLLDLWPLRTVATARAAVGVAGAGGLLTSATEGRGARLAGAVAAAALVSAAIAGAPALYDGIWERLQLKREYDGRRFAEVVENRHGVITVSDDGVVWGNGAYDGAFSVDPVRGHNGIIRAYAVAGLHPAPRRVLVVGIGSGSWTQVLAQLPGVEHITVIEINPGYLSLIARHREVRSVLTNPRVEIVIDDGRRWLTRHPDARFDVVVANTSIHWRANTTNLLSQEYVALVKAHLAPGGVYYFNTTFYGPARETALAALARGLEVGSMLAASDEPITFDVDRVRRLLQEVRFEDLPGAVVDARREADRRLLESLPLRVRPVRAREGVDTPLVTDDNMLPEWHGRGSFDVANPVIPGAH